MVEVDPIVLAAGAAAIAVLSVVSCTRNSGNRDDKNKNQEKGEKKNEKTKKVQEEKVETVEKTVSKSEKKNKKAEKESASVAAAPVASATPAPTQQPKESKAKTNAATPAQAPAKAAAAPATIEQAKPTAKVSTPEASQEPVAATSEAGDKKKKAKETPEQKAARLERQKKRKEEAATTTTPTQPALETERVEFVSRAPPADEWEVVDKKKQKAKKPPATAPTGTTPTAAEAPVVPAAPEQTTSKLTVDPKKIGIIIGPKGATLRSIQELTEATINMPKADRDTNAKSASISIVGSADAVQNASNIIIELCTKGYSTRLEGENFQESHLSVHNQFLSEIIGKNGASIKALQDKLGVRITIPQNAGKDNNPLVKIGIAGDRENINRAKEVVREIMTYYHSPITHPGYVHVSLDIPARMYNSIIGAKGGEIRHIQNNFKVAVHIPNSNSLTQHVIVVGENSHQVDNAVRYIQKIVQQITNEEAKTQTVVETWNEQNDLLSSDEPEPEWVSQYMYNREASQQVNLMAAVNVPISLSTAESNAWKMGDAAEGW